MFAQTKRIITAFLLMVLTSSISFAYYDKIDSYLVDAEGGALSASQALEVYHAAIDCMITLTKKDIFELMSIKDELIFEDNSTQADSQALLAFVYKSHLDKLSKEYAACSKGPSPVASIVADLDTEYEKLLSDDVLINKQSSIFDFLFPIAREHMTSLQSAVFQQYMPTHEQNDIYQRGLTLENQGVALLNAADARDREKDVAMLALELTYMDIQRMYEEAVAHIALRKLLYYSIELKKSLSAIRIPIEQLYYKLDNLNIQE